MNVCSFESRRAADMRSLIERRGGTATIAPSMQEIPLEENSEAFAFAEALIDGRIDVVIFMTGVGARALLAAVETRFDRAAFFEALGRASIVVRGPKPLAVLREWKVPVDHRVPEPNTWRELLALVDAELPVAGKTVAVQEYGRPNAELYAALEQRGAQVWPVPVYRWALPDDTGPLLEAIQATIAGRFDVLMFTSAQQLQNVLDVAESAGLRAGWLTAARQCVIASIGPTASETLAAEGLPADFEPSHPKMGHLVNEALAAAPEILQRKRLE
jgi:uroporphyrinogen-III synthase